MPALPQLSRPGCENGERSRALAVSVFHIGARSERQVVVLVRKRAREILEVVPTRTALGLCRSSCAWTTIGTLGIEVAGGLGNLDVVSVGGKHAVDGVVARSMKVMRRKSVRIDQGGRRAWSRRDTGVRH